MLKFISFFLSPEGLLPEPSAFLPHLDGFPSRFKIAPQAFFQYYSVLEPMSPLLSSHDLGVGPRFAGAHHEKDTGVVKFRILEFWMSLIFISQQGTMYFRNHFLSEFCRLCYIAFSSLYVSNFLICNFLFGEFQDFFPIGWSPTGLCSDSWWSLSQDEHALSFSKWHFTPCCPNILFKMSILIHMSIFTIFFLFWNSSYRFWLDKLSYISFLFFS